MKTRLLLLAALALAACDQVYDVTIEISDGAAARGFACSNDAGYIFAERLAAKPDYIVLDVIDLGTDILSCRSTSIIEWCLSHDCAVVKRRVTPIVVSAGNADSILAQAYEQLNAKDGGIADIPTDRTVIVRFVATTEDQTDPAKVLDPSKVGGCVYSCPVRLNASGTIDLDLDAPPFADCQLAVAACADFPDAF